MCRTFTFYHLCGHVHHTHNITCTSPVPFTSFPPPSHSPTGFYPDRKIISPSPACAETLNEPHHYPTLCNSCKKIGIISDWFAKSPGARMEATMEWRRLEGSDPASLRAPSTANANALNVLDTRDRIRAADAGDNLEEMPFIQGGDLELQSNSGDQSRSASAGSATKVIHVVSPVSSTASTSPPSSTSSIESSPSSPPPLPPLPKWLLALSEESKEGEAAATTSKDPADPDLNTPPSNLRSSPFPPSESPSPCHANLKPSTDLKSTVRNASMRVNQMAARNRSMAVMVRSRSRLPVPAPASAAGVVRGGGAEGMRSQLPVPKSRTAAKA